MRRREVALILSLICCGLGQIYNGQILKGIDFIIMCAMLIVAAFSSIVWLHIAALSILPFIWFLSVADAYISHYEFVTPRKWLLVALPAFAISLLIFLFQLWFQMPPRVNIAAEADTQITKTPLEERNARVETSPDSDSSENTQTPDQSDNLENNEIPDQFDGSDFFSIQAGNFRDLENAENLRDELLYKGYLARIEDLTSTDGRWYRVLIGKYQKKADAITIAEELREREKILYMIVDFHSKEVK